MDTQERIKDMVTKHKVFLFMKGSPEAPECGFSMKLANILKELHVEFAYFNIFDDPEIRQGVKTYSNWPTIPQLYINGKFIGGSDIVQQMHDKGEIKKLLES